MVRLGVAAWVPGSRFHLYFDSTIIKLLFLYFSKLTTSYPKALATLPTECVPLNKSNTLICIGVRYYRWSCSSLLKPSR